MPHVDRADCADAHAGVKRAGDKSPAHSPGRGRGKLFGTGTHPVRLTACRDIASIVFDACATAAYIRSCLDERTRKRVVTGMRPVPRVRNLDVQS